MRRLLLLSLTAALAGAQSVFPPAATNTGAAAWGQITGSLSSQSDLNSALAGKQATITVGNFTESTSNILTITGGSGAIIGSGLSVQVKQAGASQSGFLSSSDWSTFNAKQAALTLTTIGSSGAATLSGATLNIPQYSGGGAGATINTVASSGSSQTLSWPSTGDVVYDITLSANCTISISSPTATNTLQRMYLVIRPAGFQATLPASGASLVWAAGSSPTPSTSSATVITLFSDGATPIFAGI